MEKKLPEGVMCQDNSDKKETRREAESVLSNLAKHLAALKDSKGRLNDEAKRSYLQVRFHFS